MSWTDSHRRPAHLLDHSTPTPDCDQHDDATVCARWLDSLLSQRLGAAHRLRRASKAVHDHLHHSYPVGWMTCALDPCPDDRDLVERLLDEPGLYLRLVSQLQAAGITGWVVIPEAPVSLGSE